ncbi:MAG TPA: tRNA pseudouridine(38-40) synthase TruA [Flavitalea sp.]|nr:tRNA pseudouridine(38-40) synthase TruA [Flavitalea sp.]
MKRYFIEVSYHGQAYSGFQIQDNANTVQLELEKALKVLVKTDVSLTGSSRTDSGVHAQQNYFHFDTGFIFTQRHLYNINALLRADIALISMYEMPNGCHCRFDAMARRYTYRLHQRKDPFMVDRSYYYPYKVNMDLLLLAAKGILGVHNFSSYSKRNTQVKNFMCEITESVWEQEDYRLSFTVRGNRFLRGMVRGLVGTMLKVGTGRISLDQFMASLSSEQSPEVDFAVPGKGLTLERVEFPVTYFERGIRL